MEDGQRENVWEPLKIKLTSNVPAIILQILLSCSKLQMVRYEFCSTLEVGNYSFPSAMQVLAIKHMSEPIITVWSIMNSFLIGCFWRRGISPGHYYLRWFKFVHFGLSFDVHYFRNITVSMVLRLLTIRSTVFVCVGILLQLSFFVSWGFTKHTPDLPNLLQPTSSPHGLAYWA
jgi:hypothetical protein